MRHASRMLLTAAVVVLVASALSAQPLPRQPGLRPPRRPRPGMPPPVRDSRPPGTPYGSGTKTLEVDCGKTVGTIRSLLGVNRGPLSWARKTDNVAADHTESLRSIGVDFIRTHDFYGPTDWHVIFPDFKAENICDEWNAGIKHRLFNHTPAGAAFYASTLTSMLDGGVDHAFQYCADAHPGLGLHERGTGRLKICADAFAAWKRLLETPVRVAATGGDARGYAVVAGKDPVGHRVRILISDFQSGHDAFALRVGNLPWDEDTPFTVKRSLIDARHRLETVEETTARGRSLTIDKPFSSASVCLIEIDRHM